MGSGPWGRHGRGGAGHQGAPPTATRGSGTSQHLCGRPFSTLLCFSQTPLKPTGPRELLLRDVSGSPASPSPWLGQQVPGPEWVMSATCHPNSGGSSAPAGRGPPVGTGHSKRQVVGDITEHQVRVRACAPVPAASFHGCPRHQPSLSGRPPCSLLALHSPGEGAPACSPPTQE